MIARLAMIVALAVLVAGCASAPRIEAVKVPVLVYCQAAVPDRPAMPTESMAPGVTLFEFVRAAQAEIERREGFEHQLRTALLGCMAPSVEPQN